MGRTCYRSKWRIHEDPTILTPGRYYRAADDAPAAPFAHYLGSREWTPDKLNQEFGEWGGAQGYDQGVPPRVLPNFDLVGGDCMSRLLPAPAPEAPARQLGRCIDLPTQSICGNIPLFTNFSIAYPEDITYYEIVPTYITKDKGEGEWLGRVPNFDATAQIRVTETAGVLEWAFALRDDRAPFPEPAPYDCIYCEDSPVRWWTVSIAGVVAQAGHPEIDGANGDWILPYVGACRWRWTRGDITVQLFRFEAFTVALAIIVGGVTTVLLYQSAEGDFNCADPDTLPRQSFNATYVADSPTEVLMIPVI